MLTRGARENKDALGDEVLKMCRSLYGTKHMLPAQVGASLRCPLSPPNSTEGHSSDCAWEHLAQLWVGGATVCSR